MRIHTVAVLIVSVLASQTAMPQSADAIYAEYRDAASAYIGTNNFIVGRLGAECLSMLGRTESPKEFVQAWQQRNAKYLAASIKYMGKRLDGELTSGGAERRDAVLRDYSAAVQNDGQLAANKWLSRGTQEDACKRAIAAIEAGAMDISPKSPMYGEIEALVSWAQ